MNPTTSLCCCMYIHCVLLCSAKLHLDIFASFLRVFVRLTFDFFLGLPQSFSYPLPLSLSPSLPPFPPPSLPPLSLTRELMGADVLMSPVRRSLRLTNKSDTPGDSRRGNYQVSSLAELPDELDIGYLPNKALFY